MSDELKPHLDALRRWIEHHADIPTPAPSISGEERKQLHAVNKSIQQLTALGVSIPDDLRKLKLRLAGKDTGGAGSTEIENRLVQTESLVENLRELTQAARSLRDRLKGTGQNSGTKKHYGVSLEELLESGHLSTEDKLELQWQKDGPVFEGKVRADGSVTAKTAAGWKQFDTLSAAAASIGERALNGWDHWRRINRDGSSTTLKDVRTQFMNEGGDS